MFLLQLIALFLRAGGDYYSRSSRQRSIHPSNINKQKDSPVKVHYKDEQSFERLASRRTTDSRNYPDNMDSRKKDQDIKMYMFLALHLFFYPTPMVCIH